MKIKSILITLFVLTMIISPASAGWVIQIPTLDDIFGQDLEVFVSPGGTIIAQPDQQVIYDLTYYNQYSSDYNFQTDAYIGSNRIGRSPVVEVAQGDFEGSSISITAPSTPGTYSVEFYSFYGGIETVWWEWDHEVFTTLIVSSATHTPTPTATATATSTATAAPTATPTPNNPPTVNVILTKSVNTLNYDASSSTDVDGSIVTREWSVDGMVMGTSDTYSVNMDNLDAGDHAVKFTATDNDGAKGIYDHYFSITVTNDVVTIEDETEQYADQDSPDAATGDSDETAPFVMNIGGQPYYIPGFTAMFAIAGLLAVAYLIHRKEDN